MARKKFRRRRRRRRRNNRMTLYRNPKYIRGDYKYRQIFNAVTDDDGQLFILIAPWSFTNFYTNTASGGNAVSVLNEPLNYQKKQYDYYRPNFIKIDYLPFSNNAGPYQTVSTPRNLTPNMYYCLDSDNKGAPSSVASLITRDKVYAKNCFESHSVSFRLPRIQQGGNVARYYGWNNAQMENTNVNGSIWCITNNIFTDSTGVKLSNTQVGEIMVTYYCSFRDRQYNTQNTDANLRHELPGFLDYMSKVGTGILYDIPTGIDPSEPPV